MGPGSPLAVARVGRDDNLSRMKNQPAAVGNEPQLRSIVSGLLFTMDGATPTCRAVSARPARAGGEAAGIPRQQATKVNFPLRRTMPDQDGGHSRSIHAFANRLASACETPDMRNLRNLFFATPRHEKEPRGRPSSPVMANAVQIN